MEALVPDGHPQKYIYLATMLFTAIAVLHSTMTMQIRWNSTILKKDSKPTICVSMDKTGMPIAGKLISNTVNKLAEYLSKY